MRNECKHPSDSVEWLDEDGCFLGCHTCNGSLRVSYWKCTKCGARATTSLAQHDAGEPCNPLVWDEEDWDEEEVNV